MIKKILLIILLMSVPLIAGATQFVPECADAEYRDGQADLVVVAKRVGELETRKVESGNIETLIQFEVKETIKGEVSEDGLFLKQPGGTLADGTRQEVPSLTLDWSKESNWRLALIENQDGTHSLVCGIFGRSIPGQETLKRQALPRFKDSLKDVFGGFAAQSEMADAGSGGAGSFLPLFIIVMIWSLVWKGIALWYAARESQKAWFVVLLVVNLFGILEIMYLLFWRRDGAGRRGDPSQRKPQSDAQRSR